jgi:hypothetical protein
MMSFYAKNNVNYVYVFLCILLGVLISGCTPLTKVWPDTSLPAYSALKTSSQPKSIFVFFDGTGNDPETPTNVWRLYELMENQKDPLTIGFYVEGVGANKGLAIREVLGLGMENRIKKGYSFITKNYKPGDKIYIFGFSRGALEARSLAGLIAYSGLPKISDEDVNHLEKIANKILERTKDKNDSDYEKKWEDWTPGDPPLLADEIRNKLGLEVQNAEVTFLGIWDTVPGSFFLNYNICKEKKNRKDGDRYKTDSYPAIRNIIHAVSIDEKRSKFQPILACPPINNTNATKINELWFPGAHADVGGGYKNPDPKKYPNVSSNDLPNISLNWMIGMLHESYRFKEGKPTYYLDKGEQVSLLPEKIDGLAHWSYGDFPGNLGSNCIDRKQQLEELNDPTLKKLKILNHPSYEERLKLGHAPIEKGREVEISKYPLACPKD